MLRRAYLTGQRLFVSAIAYGRREISDNREPGSSNIPATPPAATATATPLDADVSRKPGKGNATKQSASEKDKEGALQRVRAQLKNVPQVKEEVSLFAICFALIVVLWYWMSSNHRRTVRLCEASQSQVSSKLKELKDDLTRLEKTWTSEMKTRENSIHEVLDQNRDLTRVIDQMTAQLKHCN